MADNAPFGAYLRYATDASGNVTISATDGDTYTLNGFPRSVRSNIMTRCPIGAASAVANYGGLTHHIQAALAGVPVAVRIGIANASTQTPTIAGSFGFAPTAGAVNSDESKGINVATWTPLTFDGGASSATHAARTSSNTYSPTWVWSDWIGADAMPRTDGASGAIIHLRLLQGTAGGEATTFNNMWTSSTTTEAVATHIWRGYRTSTPVDYATVNRASFTSGNAIGLQCACIIQYATIVPGVTMVTAGNSIWAGTANGDGGVVAQGYGWAARARDLLHTAKLPVELCNLAAPSQGVDVHYNRVAALAPELRDTLLFPLLFSTNDTGATISAANITKMRRYFGLYLSLAEKNRMLPFYQTSAPCNAAVVDGGLGGSAVEAFGTSDALRTALDLELLASPTRKLDVASVLSGAMLTTGASAGQIEYKPGYSSDGLHPNDAGYTAWAAALASVLRGII